jgi:predicted PurR-regulated permease PerM
MIIAYIFYPVYDKLNKKTNKKNLSAFITSFIIILLLVIPLFFIINSAARETGIFYVRAKQMFIGGEIFNVECEEGETGGICSLSNFIKEISSRPQVRFYFEDTLGKISTFIISQASKVVFSIPLIILNLFVTLFVTFYLFRDGKIFVQKTKSLLLLRKGVQQKIINKLNDTIHAVIFGQIIISLAQGTLGAIGLAIFGVSSPVLWGIVMVIASLIPFVGTPIVWVPAGISLILTGYFNKNVVLIWKGVGLLIYGIFIISTIDNILRPALVGARGRVHPILVLLGALGGLRLFGFIGFIIGPLVLVLFITLLQIYEKEKNEINC